MNEFDHSKQGITPGRTPPIDRSKEETAPGRTPPNIAFRRAMIGVTERCGQLAAQIDKQELESIKGTIDGAVTLWIAGREACRQLIESNRKNSPYATAARQLLEEVYVKLLDAIRAARELVSDPRTQSAVDESWLSLVQTMAQPLTECGDIQRGKHCHSE